MGKYGIHVQKNSTQVYTGFIKYFLHRFYFLLKRGIGALPNFVRPFHHYALRTTHYALFDTKEITYKKVTSNQGFPQSLVTSLPVT